MYDTSFYFVVSQVPISHYRPTLPLDTIRPMSPRDYSPLKSSLDLFLTFGRCEMDGWETGRG